MDQKSRTKISKFLSYVLRHRPDAIGLQLDKSGWVEIDVLLVQCAAHQRPISTEELIEVVAKNPKQRFALSGDGTKIRANQGHSVDVELSYRPQLPPEFLFHGTVEKFLPAIRRQGLLRMQRHHVHLSADEGTAKEVGRRRGTPVVLRIRALEMQQRSFVFYLSTNGVWLTEEVPPEFIESSF